MSDGSPITLFGDFGPAANTLVRKIFEAAGGVFAPMQMKRVAKAEVAADLIRAEGEIQRDEVYKRAAARFVAEEIKKQENVEAIIAESVPLLSADAKVDAMDNDWIANFTDKAKLISTEEMRKTLARILAAQANETNVFSKRTVNIVASLDAGDVRLFGRLCEFVWDVGMPTAVVFDWEEPVFTNRGLFFRALMRLEELGLLSFNTLTGFVRQNIPGGRPVRYRDQSFLLTLAPKTNGRLELGQVMLSQTGAELSTVIDSPFDLEARDAVLGFWRSKGHTVEIQRA